MFFIAANNARLRMRRMLFLRTSQSGLAAFVVFVSARADRRITRFPVRMIFRNRTKSFRFEGDRVTVSRIIYVDDRRAVPFYEYLLIGEHVVIRKVG